MQVGQQRGQLWWSGVAVTAALFHHPAKGNESGRGEELRLKFELANSGKRDLRHFLIHSSMVLPEKGRGYGLRLSKGGILRREGHDTAALRAPKSEPRRRDQRRDEGVRKNGRVLHDLHLQKSAPKAEEAQETHETEEEAADSSGGDGLRVELSARDDEGVDWWQGYSSVGSLIGLPRRLRTHCRWS